MLAVLPPRQRQRRLGFTLIELLVVIAIIAVLDRPAAARRPGGPRGGSPLAVRQQPEAARAWPRRTTSQSRVGCYPGDQFNAPLSAILTVTTTGRVSGLGGPWSIQAALPTRSTGARLASLHGGASARPRHGDQHHSEDGP